MTASFNSSVHSPSASAGLLSDAGDAAPNAEKHREERERSENAWALAIAQTLAEGVRPKLTLPLPSHAEAASDASATPAPAPTTGAESVGSGLGTPGASGTEQHAPSPAGPALPNRLITELSDSRLGRMELSVARGANGLHIVINVADSHVKALIEAEQALLWKSLEACGLRIDSVQIGSTLEAGTALAPQDVAQERALARSRGNPNLRSGNARWRGYAAPTDEEPEDDAERVDLTA